MVVRIKNCSKIYTYCLQSLVFFISKMSCSSSWTLCIQSIQALSSILSSKKDMQIRAICLFCRDVCNKMCWSYRTQTGFIVAKFVVFFTTALAWTQIKKNWSRKKTSPGESALWILINALLLWTGTTIAVMFLIVSLISVSITYFVETLSHHIS